MEINDLITAYEGEREKEIRGIFSSIMILQNRLQTLFDKTDPNITSKQFLLLVMVRQSQGEATLTHLGELIGSSRQNVKKLAVSLEKNGFVQILQNPDNKRKSAIVMTEKAEHYFEKITALHTKKLTDLFGDYSNEEIHSFYQLITKLYAGVDREEG